MKRIALVTAIICCIAGKDFAQAGRGVSSGPSGNSYSSVSSASMSYSGSHSYTSSSYTGSSSYSGSSSSATSSSAYAQPATVVTGPAARGTYAGENANTMSAGSYASNPSVATISSPSGGSYSYYSSPGVTSSYFPAVLGGGGVAARYNHVVNNAYPCYSTSTTRDKSTRHLYYRARIERESLLPFDYYSHIPYYYMFYYCNYFYNDYLFYNDRANTEHSSELVTLDGYLIYNTDTLSGLLTMDKKFVSLEPGTGQKGSNAAVSYSDKSLKGVVLFMGNKELHLTRLSVTDKRLSRELHTGKLNLYDDRYIFPTAGNINTAGLKVCFAGQGTIIKIRNKKQLASSVNTAYGVHLKAKDYTWAQLLAYIDTLD